MFVAPVGTDRGAACCARFSPRLHSSSNGAAAPNPRAAAGRDFFDAGERDGRTVENDVVYGFKDLQVIRPEVKPKPPNWRYVVDAALFQSDIWKNVRKAAGFWKRDERNEQPSVTSVAEHGGCPQE